MQLNSVLPINFPSQYFRNLLKSFLIIVPVLLGPAVSFSQVVYGCTDPLANNYDPSANTNNGTCKYNITTYSPPLKIDPLSDTLIETSGLQMAENYLWSFNDGGGQAVIYRIDTLTKYILQTVKLSGATNVDWEDIAYDGKFFYIGDIGNNVNGARTNLAIYKVPLSAIPDHLTEPVVTIPAPSIGVIRFTYSNQPQPPVPAGAPNATKFDCEAMIVDGGQIHLFTKNWVNLNTVHYLIPDTAAGTYIASPVDTLDTKYLVTGADRAPNRKVVALLGYQNAGTANHFMHLLSEYSGGKYFNGNVRRLDLPDVLTMGQAEGIGFRSGTYGYISNEKFVRYIGPTPIITVTQKLRSFDISGLISGSGLVYEFIGDGKWDDPTNWSNNLVPPAGMPGGSEIIVAPATTGKCVLNIPYTVGPGCTLTVNPGKQFEVQGNLSIQD